MVATDDETTIRALVHRYTMAVADRDHAAWESTWAEDGVWDLGGHRIVGRATIGETWAATMAQIVEVSHVATFGDLTVEGDAAVGRWVLDEDSVDSGGNRIAFTAEYLDTYRRTADGWRFTERRLVFGAGLS